MPTCPNCGSVLPAGAVVCSCGTSFGGHSGRDDERLNDQSEENLIREKINMIEARAKRFEAEGRYMEAVSQYYDALALDPSCAKARHALADAYLNAGEYEKALDAYAECYHTAEYYEVVWSTAYALFKLERYDDAIVKYMQTINEIRHGSMFNLFFQKDRADDAEYVEWFKERSAEIEKKRNEMLSGVWHDLGQVHDACQNYNEAIKCYEKAIAYDYGRADNWCGKAIALENKGEFVDALKFYGIAIEMDPQDDELEKNRLRCLERYGNAYMNEEYLKECEYLDEALDLAGRTKLTTAYEDKNYDILDFDE